MPPNNVKQAMLPAGAEVLVLATEGERVDLVVAVHGSVGPGHHETVGGAPIGRVAVGGNLGAAASPPHAVLCSLRHQELRRGATLGLAQVGVVDSESGGERLGKEHQPGASGGCRGDHRRQSLEVGCSVTPHDVVLHCCDSHVRTLRDGRQQRGLAALG